MPCPTDHSTGTADIVKFGIRYFIGTTSADAKPLVDLRRGTVSPDIVMLFTRGTMIMEGGKDGQGVEAGLES